MFLRASGVRDGGVFVGIELAAGRVVVRAVGVIRVQRQ
jgi:hypothetical protein